MTQDVLKLALEALEEIALAGMSGTGQESEEAMTKWHARQAWSFIGIAARALEPIKEALREHAMREVQRLGQEIEQEPVAVVDANDEGYWADILPDRNVKVGQLLYTTPPQRTEQDHIPDARKMVTEQEPDIYPEEAYEMGLEAIAYYTTPPQRTWVGLTDEDVNGFVGQYWGDEYMKMRSMVRAIEAKLKEKNT